MFSLQVQLAPAQLVKWSAEKNSLLKRNPKWCQQIHHWKEVFTPRLPWSDSRFSPNKPIFASGLLALSHPWVTGVSLEKSNIFKQKSDEKKLTLSTQMNLFVSSQHFFAEICVDVSGSTILYISESLFRVDIKLWSYQDQNFLFQSGFTIKSDSRKL